LDRISVSAPALVGNELRYVSDCIESEWISSVGTYIDRFQQAFAEYHGVRNAIATSNGTVAIHLILAALGIGPGDEVLVPSLTYVATANAVAYTGATPVLVDSEPTTMGIDPAGVAAALTERTRAVIPVHLYGQPIDHDGLVAALRGTDVVVVEDAAEALGARVGSSLVGTLGSAASFSFFGNKTISTGEGGMVVTDDDDLAARMRILRGQGMDPNRRYWFPQIGFNYRMTNMQAAVGLAQMESIGWHLAQRRRVVEAYATAFGDVPTEVLITPQAVPGSTASHWMYTPVLGPSAPIERDDLIARLDAEGVETRPAFYPMHVMPVYKDDQGKYPVATRLGARGISLPTHARLTDDQVRRVAGAVKRHLGLDG
jgi:perosamine synthetase